jgi:hypothetical protein
LNSPQAPAIPASGNRFFDVNEVWLVAVLEEGRRVEGLKLVGPPTEAARLLIAGLEGAMMLARSYGEAARFDRAGRRLLDDIIGGPSMDNVKEQVSDPTAP